MKLPKHLFRNVIVKIIRGSNHRTVTFRPNKGSVYTKGSIEEILNKLPAMIEKEYPWDDFRMVQLAPNRFNLISTIQEAKAPKTPLGGGLKQ